jgi:hypothetical protein
MFHVMKLLYTMYIEQLFSYQPISERTGMYRASAKGGTTTCPQVSRYSGQNIESQ